MNISKIMYISRIYLLCYKFLFPSRMLLEFGTHFHFIKFINHKSGINGLINVFFSLLAMAHQYRKCHVVPITAISKTIQTLLKSRTQTSFSKVSKDLGWLSCGKKICLSEGTWIKQNRVKKKEAFGKTCFF